MITGMVMSRKTLATQIVCLGLISCCLTNCYRPPYNNFKRDHPTTRYVAGVGTIGAITGGVATSTLAGTVIGGAIGGTVGGAIGLAKSTKHGIIRDLEKEDIQFVQYGDTMTLIVPTDQYFMFNSARLNELNYKGLYDIIRLLKLYPQGPVYVAGFTDNVGSRVSRNKMSQAQAETMMTYLWANGIPAQRLKAEGYGDKNDVSDNTIIHGSAQNRRIEIQWFTHAIAPVQPQMAYMTK